MLVDVTSEIFGIKKEHNVISITLKDGEFKSGEINASDFIFSGTDKAALEKGMFIRSDDKKTVSIFGIEGLIGKDNKIIVKAKTQAKQATSVRVITSETGFTVNTNDITSNDKATLGLVGTSVISSNTEIVTVKLESDKVKITSVKVGKAIITVSEESKKATIEVIVVPDGTVIINDTIKYVAPDADQAAPTGLGSTAVTVAGNDGTITNVTAEMEYRIKGDGEFIAITGTEVTGLAAGTYEVRLAARTGFKVGATAEIAVADYVAPDAEQDAPTGLGSTAVTAAGNDGTITNVTALMEYRIKGDGEFTPITGTEVTGLTAGTYEVRLAAKSGFNAGATVEVVVAPYAMLKLVSEGKAIKLADDVSVIDAANLNYMTLRVQKAGGTADKAGSQIVINKTQLLGAFNTVGYTGIVDNAIKYVSENAVKNSSAIAMTGGLTMDLEIKDGYLLVKDTKMSPELFNAIKTNGVGDSNIATYAITVLSSEDKADKIARILLTAEGTIIEKLPKVTEE